LANKGRPKKLEISHWDKKYYKLDAGRDDAAIKKVNDERIFKAFAYLHLMAIGREPNQKDVGIINKVIADILKRI